MKEMSIQEMRTVDGGMKLKCSRCGYKKWYGGIVSYSFAKSAMCGHVSCGPRRCRGARILKVLW